MTQGRKHSVWKDVPGYKGLYQVSDSGKVRSIDRVIKDENQWGKHISHRKGRDLALHPTNKVGHLKVSLCRDGVVTQYLVHVLVWKAFKGVHDVINHLNGKAWDNRLNNLQSGTQADNMRHARDYGLWYHKGELAWGAKLTEDKVKEMRLLRKAGTKLRVLADKFNVSEACCSNACTRNSWRHVA